MTEMIEFVGGPANGKKIQRPKPNILTINVPTPGGGQYQYTFRRCRDEAGNLVELLAPAGRQIDSAWLKLRKLKN